MTYVIALGIGVGIFAVSMWAIRLLATPGPEEPDPEMVEEVAVDYKCTVCGYIYYPKLGDPEGGIKRGTPFEELPDDWVCPVCGAAKSEFEKLEE